MFYTRTGHSNEYCKNICDHSKVHITKRYIYQITVATVDNIYTIITVYLSFTQYF